MDITKIKFEKPDAVSTVRGGVFAPGVNGTIKFYNTPGGTVVKVDICGLPPFRPALQGSQPVGPFGFHIHEGSTCNLGDGTNPFAGAGGHYNPKKQPHGNHAGDLPVLFSNNGCAYMVFFTDKFRAKDIIGRTVIIHQNPDDYRTEPAGNSGPRIACGVIIRYVK